MTPEEHIAAAEQCAGAGAYAAAQSHATIATAQLLAQTPICDHGNREFCIDCLHQKFIDFGFDQPR